MQGEHLLLQPEIGHLVGGQVREAGRFDGSAVATVLATDASRTAHVNALVNLVVQKGYSGIDIDYEKVPATSRAKNSW